MDFTADSIVNFHSLCKCSWKEKQLTDDNIQNETCEPIMNVHSPTHLILITNSYFQKHLILCIIMYNQYLVSTDQLTL